MRTLWAKVIVTALLAVVGTGSWAQVTIKGLVIDGTTQDALVGVNVYLTSEVTQGTTTGNDGEFVLTISKQEKDSIVFSYLGYKKLKLPLATLARGRRIVALQPRSFAMREVVVSANPLIAEEFTVKKIRKLEIYMNPSSKADPLLAVNSLPSATTTDESANISLRGSSPAETGIFFDNVPIYDAVRFSRLNGIGTFSIFNTAIVKDIHVFPGNPPLEFGNTTSGLISIQSDDNVPQKNTGSLALSLASISALRSHKLAPRSGLTIFTNLQPSALFTGINSRALPDLKKFNSADLGLHFIKRFDSKTSLKVFNYSLAESYKFQFRHPTFSGLFEQKRKRNFTVGSFKKVFKRSSFSFNGGFSHANADFDFSSSDMDLTSTYAYSSINYHFVADKFEAKLGTTFDYRRVSFKGIVPEFDFAIAPNHPTIVQSSTDEIQVPEYYLYIKYGLGSKAFVGGGLRKNLTLGKYDDYLSSQINFHYNLSDEHSLNAGVGSYHKYELPISGNQEAVLFESDQISIDYLFKNTKGSASLAIFYKRGKQPGLKQRTYGLEAFADAKISRRIKASTSFTYLNGENSSEGVKFPSEFDLSYFIRATCEYKFYSNWSLNAVLLARDGVPYTPISSVSFDNAVSAFQPTYSSVQNSERLPSYSTIDLSLNKLWPANEGLVVIFFATAGNVLNRKNVRELNYNFDYTTTFQEQFSKRIFYFGAVLNFL